MICGMFFHCISYRKVIKKCSFESALILMSGPSNDSDDLIKKYYDISVTSNLTNPEKFLNRVNSELYFHCFSDPSIISEEGKRKIFNDILDFSESCDHYYVLIPFNYIKDFKMFKLLFKKRVLIYNANMDYQLDLGLKINKYSYPNMNTILLDCALPWVSYLGTESVFVAGFDANYGTASNYKEYSSLNFGYTEKNNIKNGWSDEVKKNALIFTSLLEKMNRNKISYSHNSGFGKYINEKFNNNW